MFEEREYRCFGQWEEEETGLVYTYTDRRDVPGSECFVGKTIDGDRNVIAEVSQPLLTLLVSNLIILIL